MADQLRTLLRLFDRAICDRMPSTAEYRRLEEERRRIQRANGFDERGEPRR